MKIKINILTIGILIVLLALAGIGALRYYSEAKFVKYTNSVENTHIEFSNLLIEMSDIGNDFGEAYVAASGSKSANETSSIATIIKTKSQDVSNLIDKAEELQKQINEEGNSLTQNTLLLGNKQADFAKELHKDISLSEEEMKADLTELDSGIAWIHNFANSIEDWAIYNEVNALPQSSFNDPALIVSKLSKLSKYSGSGEKIHEASKIKSQYPKGYDMYVTYADFFGTTYDMWIAAKNENSSLSDTKFKESQLLLDRINKEKLYDGALEEFSKNDIDEDRESLRRNTETIKLLKKYEDEKIYKQLFFRKQVLKGLTRVLALQLTSALDFYSNENKGYPLVTDTSSLIKLLRAEKILEDDIYDRLIYTEISYLGDSKSYRVSYKETSDNSTKTYSVKSVSEEIDTSDKDTTI